LKANLEEGEQKEAPDESDVKLDLGNMDVKMENKSFDRTESASVVKEVKAKLKQL